MKTIISEEFLKEEEREGFIISEKMKRCWATQLKLLSMIDDICERHGLRWFADYGTLLGAVRHGGYIPWDDDIDIAMLRTDYDKLFDILPDELPPYCCIMRFGQELNLWRGWSNVNNRKNTDTGDNSQEAAITRIWYDNPYQDGIDIYPLDFVPADEHERSDWLTTYEDLLITLRNHRSDDQEYNKLVQICMLAEDIARSHSRYDAIGVGNITAMAHCGQKYRDISWYDNAITVPFEMINIPIPSGYAMILCDVYGSEWYIPQKHPCAHDYPFYKAQDEWIRDYHIIRILNEADGLINARDTANAYRVVWEGIRQYPERYELYYAAACTLVERDIYLAKDFLVRAAALCNDSNIGMINKRIGQFPI